VPAVVFGRFSRSWRCASYASRSGERPRRRRLIAERCLASYRLGGKVLVSPDGIDSLLEAGRREAAPVRLPQGSTLAHESIKVGERSRVHAGDVESLASSIADVGLLHPIVVTPDYRLVAGWRRLQAIERLRSCNA
jgi:hypothetical protein